MLFQLLASLLAHTDPLRLHMASGDILHQNNPNLATLGTSLGFMSAFSTNYAVHSLLRPTEAGIHFVIPQKEAGKERGDI